MKKITILILFILFVSNISLLAQSDSTKFKGMVYSFVPQYLINSGIRIDIEKQISGKHWIQICPQFYLGENRNDNEFRDGFKDYNNLLGGGLHLYHKIFVNWDESQKGGLYFSYGLTYDYFEIEYDAYYLGNPIDAKATINKMGGDLILGYQFLIKKKLSIDLYTGVGSRYSILDTNGDNENIFNDSYFDYNYSGNILLVGFRIGIVL